MDALITIADDDTGNLIRDLYSWMTDESELRGIVRIREADAPPGALGSVPEALQVLLGAGGAVASVLIAWLGSRRGEVTVKLTRGDEDTLEVTAKGVKGLDQVQLRALTRHVAEVLGTTDGAEVLRTSDSDALGAIDSGDVLRPADSAEVLGTSKGGQALGNTDGAESSDGGRALGTADGGE